MKNLFITGGLGQDGTLLSKIISKKKYNIFYLINKKKNKRKNGINFININLSKKSEISKIFKLNKPDIILHLASNNPAFNEKNYKKFYLDNIRASLNLFHSAIHQNKNIKFIFTSSSQIFKKKNGIVNEKSEEKITTPYTKFRIEFDKYLIKQKANFTNIILFNHDSKFRNKKFLLPRIMMAIKNKNKSFLNDIIKANIHGDFSHAEDICNAINKILTKNQKIKKIILSSNKVTSINSVIQYIIKKNKIKINLNFDRINQKKAFLIGNNHLAEKILNWKHKKNVFLAANDIYKNI